MSPAGPLIDAALRGMVLALLLLLSGHLLRERPRLPAAQAGVLLALGLAVQVVGAAPWVEAEMSCRVQSPLVGVSVANAVLFFLFVRSMFDDAFRWRAWHAGFWLFAFAVGVLNCSVNVGPAVGGLPVLHVLLRSLPLLGAALAVHAALSRWREDLVESRRRLRVFVLATGVLYTLVQVAARLRSTDGRLSEAAALLDVAGLLLIAAGICWQRLRLSPTELFPAALFPAARSPAARSPAARSAAALPPRRLPDEDQAWPAALVPSSNLSSNLSAAAPLPPASDPAEDRLALALQTAMDQDHAYRDEDLTVAALAARLAVPEYRLRRLINQRLGHRNFSSYVNAFRLAEAQAALADPARRDLPVLSIALQAGFGSIGPFNRAFKAATGQTPTEFRRDRLADS